MASCFWCLINTMKSARDSSTHEPAHGSAGYSPSLYFALFQGSADAILLADNESNYVDANPAACELLGYTKEELLGCKISDISAPISKEDTSANWVEFVQDGMQHGIHHLLKKDGSEIAVEYTAVANVMPGVHASFMRDVSARLNAEHEARRSSEMLRDFVENASIGLHWVGPDGKIEWANQAELDLLGYTRDEYIGRHIAEFHADPPVIQDILDRLSSKQTLENYEARLKAKDGSIRYVLINSNVKWEGDQFIHTRCFTRDITARKRADELRAYLGAIVDSSEDAIVGKTLDGTIESWNKGAERIFGYTAAEMIGQSIRRLLPKDRMSEEDAILARLRKGQVIDHFQTVRITKSGHPIDISVTISPIRDESGKIIGASKVARDITEHLAIMRALRKSEEDLRTLSESLEKRVEERTEDLAAAVQELQGFTHCVSHDLRGPIRAITSTSMILREDFTENLPDDAKALLESQGQAAKKLGLLVDELLRLSRLGSQQLDKAEVDLTALAQEVAGETGLFGDPTFDLKIEPGLRANADPKLLRLVIANLFENAQKFSPKGGQITVGAEETEKGQAFFIRDTGIGFDPAYKEKIFEVFKRLHRDDEYPGTGIGLANVKRIVQRHAGQVWANSEGPGRGATFFFTIPAR
jgi:PAS domain S-box-containing protein